MKLNKRNKRGISLIVLVITIIVMIILAAAIILSLNSSGIIGKANKATTESDAANKKEAASIKLAEYELAKQLGELEDPTKTANEYVKEELEKDGIDTSDLAISEDGEVLTGLTEIAVKFVEAGVKIGDVVEGYTLDTSDEAKTYTTSGNENTGAYDSDLGGYVEVGPQQAELERDNDITWKYFGIDERGEATIVGSVTAGTYTSMTIMGKGGYLNGPSELKEACEAMYSSDMGTGRSITIEDVTRVLEYTGEKGGYYNEELKYILTDTPIKISKIAEILNYDMRDFEDSISTSDKKIGDYESDYYSIDKINDASEYNTTMQDLIYPGSTATNPTLTDSYWLASPSVCAYFNEGFVDLYVRFVWSGGVVFEWMAGRTDTPSSITNKVRPVVSLKSGIQMVYENGVVTLSE